jgi:hypothetical protein
MLLKKASLPGAVVKKILNLTFQKNVLRWKRLVQAVPG